MSIALLTATALPVDPETGRARLILSSSADGSLLLQDDPSFTVTGPAIALTVGGVNSPTTLASDGRTVAVGPFLEAGPVAIGVSTVTISAYEAGVLQTGTLICTVTSGTQSGVGAYGAGSYGGGAYGTGDGAGVISGSSLEAAWSSGTVPVH